MGPYFIHSFIQIISCLSSPGQAPPEVWRRYCHEWKSHEDTPLPPQTMNCRAGIQRWNQEICTIILGYQLPPGPVFSYQRLLKGVHWGYLSSKMLCLERKPLLLRGAHARSEEPLSPLCSRLRWLLGPGSQQKDPTWKLPTGQEATAQSPGGVISKSEITESEYDCWTSLEVQWLRTCLPVRETRVRSLVWEDSTHSGATKSTRCNYWCPSTKSPCCATREAAAMRSWACN